MTGNPPNYIADRRQQEIADLQKDNSSWLLPWAAGIGAIALGAKIYKTKLATKGSLAANMLHFLGHPTSFNTAVDQLANVGPSTAASGASGIKSLYSSVFNLNKNALQLGPIDLIRDVRSTLDVLGSTTVGEARDRVKYNATEYIHRKHVNYGNHTSFFGDELQRVTVQDVLDNQKNWYNIIGKNQWDSLQEGVKEGLVSGKNIIDRNIYKTKEGIVRDVRLRNLYTKAVPDEKFGFRLTSRFDIFGQADVFKSLFGESLGVAKLAPSRDFTGPRFFIGGNVYGYSRSVTGKLQEHVLETDKILRNVNDRLEPIRAAKEDRLSLELKERKGPLGQLITKFEKATGVGTSFATRESFIQRYITKPFRRISGIASGKAAVVEVENSRGSFISSLMDRMFGAEMPEMTKAPTVTGAIKSHTVDFKNLSGAEKLAVIFDASPRFRLVSKETAQEAAKKASTGEASFVTRKNLYVEPAPTGGYKIERSPAIKQDKTFKNITGDPYYTAPESKVIPGITSIRDFASYLGYRTAHLASDTLLGISYAPAKTLMGNMARVAAVPIIYGGIAEGLEYADYAVESLTGISPKKTIASLYANLRLGQQQVRKTIGLQQAFSSLEENYPGSVDSGLGFILRSVVAPAVAFSKASKTLSVGGALAVAAGVFGLVGGVTPGQSPEELAQEYKGEKKVAIRKGRMWGMGNAPFEGGEISRYDYSWYHKIMSDYKYKSIYGSKDQYFTYHSNVFGIPFPTPSNLGGLLNIFNPYKLEEINAGERPYEATGGMFENVPVFGPALASTIGKLIKPEIRREPAPDLSRQGVLPGGLDPQTARDLGIPDINSTAPSYNDPIARMQKIANIATEPLGVYKFALEFFGVKFGSEFQELADSSMIDSPARALYGMQLGGLFGQTEFLRRFMLSDYGTAVNTAAMINRVKNTLPSWLPGSSSEFERDKSYFIDFSAGDPFLKIEDAESRLPGKGYESLNRLHSGRAGVYDAVDRFLILADVAPYSAAFKKYEAEVKRMPLDNFWQGMVSNALDYKKGMTSIENRYPRHIDSLININEALGTNPIYDVTRGLYDFVTHDVLAEIPWIGSKLAPFRDPYEKYRKQYVEGSEFPSWFTPYEDIVRPTIIDVALSNPLIGAMKGAGTAFMLASPLSPARFINPFASVSQVSAAASTIPSLVAGAAIGASMSTGRILMGMGENYVPEHVVEESSAMEYMDKLTFLKYKSLEQYSTSMGQEQQAKQFRRMQKKTMVGAVNPIGIRSSLPKSSDKRYFDVFVNAPEDKREELIAGLPPYMSQALTRVWDKTYAQKGAEEEVYQYFSSRDVPDSSWLGWHPSVDTPSMKVKMIQHGLDGVSDNYHRYGFYESHERTLKQMYPDLWEQKTTFTKPPNYGSASQMFESIGSDIAGGLGASVSTMQTPFGARYTTKIKVDNRRDTLRSYRNEFR